MRHFLVRERLAISARVASAVAVAGALLAGGFSVAGNTALAAAAASAAVAVSPPDPGSQPPLQPSAGEFASVPLFRVLDTRNGTGEPGGVAAQLAAGSPIAVPVTGVDGVPSDATSVVVNIVALNATASGYLTSYNTDTAGPNVASVGVKAGINTNQTDTIGVSAVGTVSVADHSTAPLDVVVTLMGYYTGASDAAAGDTYGDAPWVKIVDTSAGLGAPDAPIAAGGSVTVQVSGEGGIPVGADTAVLQFSANNATTNGYLTAYPAGSSDPGVSLLLYDSSMTYRDLDYVPLSSSGQITVTNHGTAPVNLVLYTRGYFMPPSATPVGAEYIPVGPDGPVTVYGGGGAVVAANSSVTFQVAGAAGLPQNGVVEVAEHVIVTDPAQAGFLDVYRGGGTDPDHATMNFLAGDGTDVGYQDSILSQVSPTGQETISNHSSGTVDVQVAVVGMFFTPQVPPVPSYLQTAAAGTAAPVLSGVVQDATGDDPTGEIFLFDSSGNPIGGSPTATGQVSSGERVSWPVTAGTLTAGATYQWYMETCDQGVCSGPSSTQVFTASAGGGPLPSATATATITGAQITGTDAVADPGACGGSDCPLTSTTTLNAGYDGTSNWVSGLKIDVSSIPAGSTIVSATLTLTRSGCLTGSSCASSPIDLYQPGSDVATDGTGPALAGDAMPNPLTAASPATQGTWDITAAVQGWVAGEPDDGLIMQAPAAGTAGISYYSPTASVGPASLPSVSVGYIPPSVPAAPAALVVTPGDQGALVTWADSPDWGYDDLTGTATASYTVQAISGGAVAASSTVSADDAVITGLANGTSYTFQVTATNPVGTGPPATSSAVTPVVVPGGAAQYISAASQFLNAQDALISGQMTTAASALSGDSMASADITQLSNENLDDSPVAVTMAAHGEQESSDTTSVSNALAMVTGSGTVTVYATADETYTTIDSSTGTTVSVPGENLDDYLLTYASSGRTPQLTGYVDADAALTQIGPGETPTASSPALDAPPPADGPAPLATDSSGNFADGPDTASYPCKKKPGGGKDGGYLCPDRSKEIDWAFNHWNKGNNTFGDDCTDFSSRALHLGGGLKEDIAPFPQVEQRDDSYWWRQQVFDGSTWRWFNSFSWSVAQHLLYFFSGQGSYFRSYVKFSQPGDLIFVNWRNKGDSNPAPGSNSINHVGVITAVNGANIYITQHTNDRKNESLYRQAGQISWFAYAPHLQVWVVVPSRKA
jgi:Putative amidase domain